uniref:Helicase-associated domain-containing protein n=1 Tax=Magnetococcus massalia (strain MO-1) TaxID=451514 RepID=A0A1S7LJN0_MAGMO|nr:Conserved protein of unknown function. Containing 8 helicase-associated domain [Candidatus Magnetococcus massalia]
MGNLAPSRLIALIENGLFDDLNHFSELEERLQHVPSEGLRHEWMACILHGLLATNRLVRLTSFQLWGDLPLSLRRQMGFGDTETTPFQAIYKSPEGGLHAVGAIFSPERKPLTNKLLSHFLEAEPKGLRRVLITNAETLPNNPPGDAPWFAIRGSDLDRLSQIDFQALRQWLRMGRSEAKRFQPPHALKQLAASTIHELNQGERRTIELPPVGLTPDLLLTMLEGLPAPHSAVIAVAGGLGRLRVLMQHFSRHASSMALGVLPFVQHGPYKGAATDRPKYNPWELTFPLYDDLESIQRFQQWRFHGIKLYLTTLESLPSLEPHLTGEPPLLRIITDGHKTAGKRSSRFPYLFATGQDGDTQQGEESAQNFPQQTEPATLFLTHAAEPLQSGKLTPNGDPKVRYSMALGGDHGTVVHPLSYLQAVEQQLARPVKLHLAVHFMPKPTEAGSQLEDRLKAAQWRAVRQVLSRIRAHRVLSSHVNAKEAASFYTSPGRDRPDPMRDGYAIACFDGKAAAPKREALWQDLQADPPMVLAHARCLVKGEPCPPVDALLLVPSLNDKSDLADLMQPLLRPRLDGATPTAHLILPLIFHNGYDEEGHAAGEPHGLQDLLDLLLTLKKVDESLAALLHEIRLRQGIEGTLDPTPLWNWLEVSCQGVSIDHFKERFGPTILDAMGGEWEQMLGAMAAALKQGEESIEDPALKKWAAHQRKTKELQSLPATRIEALEAVGFDWDPAETHWQTMYQKLRQFKLANGHDEVPEPYEAEPELASWTRVQRRAGFLDKLNGAHRKQLEEIHFIWDLKAAHWQGMFEKLVTFKRMTGHDRVPEEHPGNPALHQWVTLQRRAYKAGKLEVEHIYPLEQIQFVWDLEEQDWQLMLARLKAFQEAKGNLLPDSESQPQLYQWCDQQRKLYNKEKMPPEHQQMLSAIGFDWDPANTLWWQMHEQLSSYHQEQGHSHLPSQGETLDPLRSWCGEQRKLYKNDKLAEDRLQALTQLDFVWDAKEGQWHSMRMDLTAYRTQRRHCHVPKGWAENIPLAKWVQQQRNARKKELLSEEQIALLDELDFIWDAQELYWEQMFIQLVEYHTLYGHCNVPEDYADDPELAWWVEAQRKSHKNSSLGTERTERLDELAFVWDPQRLIWEGMFAKLEAFHSQHGHSTVPKVWPADSELARWVQNQRNMGSKGMLSELYMEKLESIGFVWDAKQAQAEELFQQLSSFRDRFGHCNVPVDWNENPQLGLWVQFQKQSKQDGRLDPSRVERLEQIGIQW